MTKEEKEKIRQSFSMVVHAVGMIKIGNFEQVPKEKLMEIALDNCQVGLKELLLIKTVD